MNDKPHAPIRQMQDPIREQPAATREARTVEAFFAEIWERPWLAVALIATVPGILLAVLGPFGSFTAPLWMRFAYWVPTMAIGAILGIWTEQSPLFDRRPLLRIATMTTLMTIAMSFVAYAGGVLVFGPGAMRFSPIFVFMSGSSPS